jgi:amidase
VCEIFRHYPDALERAAELDAAYGRDPDLESMPMYGVVFSFKDPFDTKDMRSTAGGDAAYDIDMPARDHVLVAQLRSKGAIIYAKAFAPSTTAAPAIPAADTSPPRYCRRPSAISAAAGRAIQRTPTTPRARPRSGRARARRCPSASTS